MLILDKTLSTYWRERISPLKPFDLPHIFINALSCKIVLQSILQNRCFYMLKRKEKVPGHLKLQWLDFSSKEANNCAQLLVPWSFPRYFFILLIFCLFTVECDPANFVIRGVLIPILAILGTIANILIIKIFNKPKLRSPVNTILMGKNR